MPCCLCTQDKAEQLPDVALPQSFTLRRQVHCNRQHLYKKLHGLTCTRALSFAVCAVAVQAYAPEVRQNASQSMHQQSLTARTYSAASNLSPL